MRDVVVFQLNGVPHSVEAPDPNQTVLEWLRDEQRLTGTKEGCAEGDCGACTVAVVDADGALTAINACIAFLPTVDGKAVYTVEGLKGVDAELHPVQSAMIEEHGSQCGFCTPGIVMALAVHHARASESGDEEKSSEALCRALSGNLCRCTGYAPILRAAERALDEPAPRFEAPTDVSEDMLGYRTRSRIDGSERSFFAPRNLSELDDVLSEARNPVFLAGGTDVGLWVTKHRRELTTLISTRAIAELRTIEETDAHFTLGAAVTYAEAASVLEALQP
ncbi:MAG: 2Fe-2S iron-sulfur cluster-binding protein [Myxococcota bacterium]